MEQIKRPVVRWFSKPHLTSGFDCQVLHWDMPWSFRELGTSVCTYRSKLSLSCQSQPGEFGVWPGCTWLVGMSSTQSHFSAGRDWLVLVDPSVSFSTEAGQHLGKPGNRVTRPNDDGQEVWLMQGGRMYKNGFSIWFLQRFAGASRLGVRSFSTVTYVFTTCFNQSHLSS